MFTALLIFQVVLGLTIIGLVLLQQGKGADMGAAFGAGSAGTVFGSRGGGSFFTRATAVLAALFFINSIVLSSPLVRNEQDPNLSVTETLTTVEEVDVPAVEETAGDEAVDLPPADLPEVQELTGEATSDLPEVPESTEDAAGAESDLPR